MVISSSPVPNDSSVFSTTEDVILSELLYVIPGCSFAPAEQPASKTAETAAAKIAFIFI